MVGSNSGNFIYIQNTKYIFAKCDVLLHPATLKVRRTPSDTRSEPRWYYFKVSYCNFLDMFPVGVTRYVDWLDSHRRFVITLVDYKYDGCLPTKIKLQSSQLSSLHSMINEGTVLWNSYFYCSCGLRSSGGVGGNKGNAKALRKTIISPIHTTLVRGCAFAPNFLF